MSEILGMHWTLALTLISVIMLILDLFIFSGGVLTFIADVFFTFIILHFVPTENWIYLLFFGIFIYTAVLILHYFLYRKFILYLIDNFIAPQKYKNNNDILLGKTGSICLIKDRWYIYLENEYIPCIIKDELMQHDLEKKKAKVISWNDSKELVVEII